MSTFVPTHILMENFIIFFETSPGAAGDRDYTPETLLQNKTDGGDGPHAVISMNQSELLQR